MKTRERFLISSADFDPERIYRYSLRRVWDLRLPAVLFVMLNPSTADENHLDPTLRRCVGYARAWGYGKLLVGNLFALRATDPTELYSHPSPDGPLNDATLSMLAGEAEMVVAAWGNHGDLHGRDKAVEPLLTRKRNLFSLTLTRAGAPGHPLYLPGDLVPVLYRSCRNAA